MQIDQLIKSLEASDLYAECSCGEEFKLAGAILFDGTKSFPTEALGTQNELNTLLETRNKELTRKMKLATEASERTTKAVNIGKNFERALPIMKGFKWVVPDSKFLGDPIDLLVFNGLSMGKVNSLSFVEVKSGNAKLNDHQKSIRDAIGDHKVSYEVFV
jgi:predicted Holliday junction resolvase-like endonuclease